MKLLEYEGKALFRSHGITTPKFVLFSKSNDEVAIVYPVILKSQVPSGDRMAKGGIVIVPKAADLDIAIKKLFITRIDGNLPEYLLAEELIVNAEELYVSFSYSSEKRAPVLALNKSGGSNITHAIVTPVNILIGCNDELIDDALECANIKTSEALVSAIKILWKIFCEEHLILAEINPLFLCADGKVIAGDAKMVRDEALIDTSERPFVELGGDIAVIASGGGASMLNIDILMRAGGKPANYVEYSGNPPASVVEEMTQRVLAQPDIRGLWVVGGTANFTDIYETMSGFISGLRKLPNKPNYPIVIRRDGPRQKEARAMLEDVAQKEGYNIHVFGPEISMAESARILIDLMEKRDESR